MTETDPVAIAAERYRDLQAQADTAKEALLNLCADRVGAHLDTADSLAPRAHLTAVTIRKALRERGVGALTRGPKRKTDALGNGGAGPHKSQQKTETRSGAGPEGVRRES